VGLGALVAEAVVTVCDSCSRTRAVDVGRALSGYGAVVPTMGRNTAMTVPTDAPRAAGEASAPDEVNELVDIVLADLADGLDQPLTYEDVHQVLSRCWQDLAQVGCPISLRRELAVRLTRLRLSVRRG
jgi:hypothetical protein